MLGEPSTAFGQTCSAATGIMKLEASLRELVAALRIDEPVGGIAAMRAHATKRVPEIPRCCEWRPTVVTCCLDRLGPDLNEISALQSFRRDD